MSTWFVIHVKPGAEAQAVELLRAAPKADDLEELFCPMSITARLDHGETVEERVPLLPGCVFAVAPSKWELRACMRRAEGMDALLERDRSFQVMEDGEETLINLLTAPGERIVQLSEGVVERGRVVVKSGPLMGREREIRKVSHRKRRAYLDAHVAGVPVTAELGLHVTRVSQAAEGGG